MRFDVAIVGGGPAGLAVAIDSARQGLRTVLLERGPLAHDKACGEGVMPAGLRALEALGVLGTIAARDMSRIEGIRYVQEDGSAAEGKLPGAGGLGIRRTALVAALTQRAREVGADVRGESALRAQRWDADGVTLETDAETLRACIVVAADGLQSPLRRAAGLQLESTGPRRFGLRQHFRCRAWTPFVEVHLAPGAEAYVTPCGEQRVGVAFLWNDGRFASPLNLKTLLAHFPRMAARLEDSAVDSVAQGAGPFFQRARAVTAERLALVGDAAGYVDAMTGEGLSLGLCGARALARVLPQAVREEGFAASLEPYALAYGRLYRHYARGVHGLMALAQRPRLRRPVVRWLGRNPRVFEAVLRRVVDLPSLD